MLSRTVTTRAGKVHRLCRPFPAENLARIDAWLGEGLTNDEIRGRLGDIAEATFYQRLRASRKQIVKTGTEKRRLVERTVPVRHLADVSDNAAPTPAPVVGLRS